MTLFDRDEQPSTDAVRFERSSEADEPVAFNEWLAQKTPPGANRLGAASSFVDESPHPAADRARGANERPGPDQIREQAYREGVEDSRREIDALETQYKARLESLTTRVVDRIAALERAVVQRVNTTAVAIAEAMARSIVGAELELRPEQLVSAVQKILDRATGLGDITIHVHPDAVDNLRAYADRLETSSGAHIAEITGDSNLEFGDVRVVGTAGRIDALLSERLDQLSDLARTELGFLEVEMMDELADEPTEASDPEEAGR